MSFLIMMTVVSGYAIKEKKSLGPMVKLGR